MKLKKILCFALSMMVTATCFVGCGGGIFDNPDDVQVDVSKTQLYVGVFDGGLGRSFFEETAAAFEESCSEVSFETGKKGVQIILDWGKEEYGSSLIDTISTNRQEVYAFANAGSYYDYINRGHLLDISDVVTEGGENSIENKMNASLRNFYRVGDSKYYSIPVMEGYIHMIYDVDLFDKEHFWFAPDGDFVKVDNASTTPGARRAGLSGGVDGWDAGLPETYSEFFILLEEMVARGIIPFTWSGAQIGTYTTRLAVSMWADYQGADEFAQTFTLDGTVPVKVISDTDFTESAVGTYSVPSGKYSTSTITRNNAQEISAKEAGKYYALKLVHDIMYSKKYVNQKRVNSPAESHLGAQATYLQSIRTSQKIAMIIEGPWWQNEAEAVFSAMEMYGSQYSSMNRRFGIMPIPKADDGTSADGRVFTIEAANPTMFISNYIAKNKIDLAKNYLRFLNTEESMCKFTLLTKTRRPFNYSLTNEELATLPYYVRNLVEASKDITIEYLVPRTNDLRVHAQFFDSADYAFNSNHGGSPFAGFFNYPDYDALSWFKGLDEYRKIFPYNFNI